MKKVVIQPKYFRSSPKWVFFTSLSNFKLQTLTVKMKHSISWAKEKLRMFFLFNSPEKIHVVTELHNKTEAFSLKTSDSINLQVNKGHLIHESEYQLVSINNERVLTHNQKEEYKLLDSEETLSLLTMTNKN